MGGWLFLGGFLAVLVAIIVIVVVVRRKVRRLSNKIFGTANMEEILGALSEVESEAEYSPRSLNGCDTLLLPQILRDFPDFDVSLAKTYVRDYLKEKLGSKKGFTIYNVVIAQYRPSSVQKTIIFQAAVSWLKDGRKQQKRFDLHYTYLLGSNQDSIATNCPNCGGALGYGDIECPYCGSRVVNILGNTWEFTEMRES